MTTATTNGGALATVTKRLPKPQNDGAAHVFDHIEAIQRGLPNFIDRDQFAYAVMVAANESDLRKCSAISILNSAANCARVGLMPGKTLGLAHFVPFKGECKLMIGYPGFLDLAYRNKFLKDIYTNVILRGESARQWADEDGIRFEHDIPMDRELKPDDVTHAYCIAKYTNGGRSIRVINRQQINAAKKDTPAWNDTLGFIEQCMKTAIRRSAKQWKLTPELALAVELDQAMELDQQQPVPQITTGFKKLSLDDPKPEATDGANQNDGEEPASDPRWDEPTQEEMFST